MDYFAGSSNVQGQRMVVLEVVEPRVMAVASAGTVEALEADIEACRVILKQGTLVWRQRNACLVLTIESKHIVQSSR